MDSTQLLKGVLDTAVLAVLEAEDGYGYDIVRRLRDSGFTDIGDASVYGTLRRLYSAGALSSYLVASTDGPHRKYYGLKPEGARQLKVEREQWLAFAATMTNVLAETKTTKKAGKDAH